ncbi:MAG TPA: hypothetical protein VFU63_13665 [Ktedonobacterales bacterium]|nr:hypothetical protein [Ktedonobacterales bacterium]
MNWELLGPAIVVLFELLVFVGTVAVVAYAAREHDREPQPAEFTQPSTAEPTTVPSHAA